MPVLLLVWVFACYGPSAFYLAVAAVVPTNGSLATVALVHAFEKVAVTFFIAPYALASMS